MCFSLGASLTTAAVLIPAGLLCLKKATQTNRSYQAFAILPFAFGIQQIFEGGVWWALGTGNDEVLRLSTLGFLFFSHFFWLTWVPLSCFMAETLKKRRIFFLTMAVAGAACGGMMYLPFLLNSHWLEVSVVHHSIVYETTLFYDDYLPRVAGTTIYILIIVLSLTLSSDRYHRILGALILISVIVSLTLFNYAFISVWCFLAALLSLYIYYVIVIKAQPSSHLN